MAEADIFIEASPEFVFEVLLDAGTYPEWVVGCQQIRSCDPSWPAPGSRFHHRVGIGPLSVNDSTAIVSIEAPSRLVLEARAGLAGTAHVAFDVTPEKDGCRVTITEEPVRGVGAILRNFVQDGLLQFRNEETLNRLRECVQRRKENQGRA